MSLVRGDEALGLGPVALHVYEEPVSIQVGQSRPLKRVGVGKLRTAKTLSYKLRELPEVGGWLCQVQVLDN